MKMIVILIAMVSLVTVVSAFPISTSSYTVDKTNLGLSGSELESTSYDGRMYWEPWQPASQGETTLYFLQAGYFESITQEAAAVTITLNNPTNNEILNDANITFTHTATSNGTIESCNLLVYYDATLTINDTVAYPGMGSYNWSAYPLAEDDYNWKVSCTSGGQTSTSNNQSFTVDRTAPSVTILEPLDAITAWEQFEFDINEAHPDYLVITANGTNYTYNYTNGTNTYQPSLPLGIYEFNLTIYDQAGNVATINNNDIYVIDVPVTFTNQRFSPTPIFDELDNELSIKIGGTFTDVILSVNINGTGWTNYTVNTFTGTGPFTYYRTLTESMYTQGEWIAQKWYARDSLGIFQESNTLNQTVTRRTGGGGGGSFPDDEPTTGETRAEGLFIDPQPLQINNLQGVLFDVRNNGTATCNLVDIYVEDRLGSTELQDAFTTNTLSLEGDLKLEPGESLGFQIRPRGFQGIAGVGAVIVESDNCATIEAPLSVNIYWLDITIDTINDFTDNVINYFRGIIGVL